MKGTCRNCGRRREVRSASRFGGGSYKRAGRSYRSAICSECVTELLGRLTPGHWSVDRWAVASLRDAARAFELKKGLTPS